MLDLVHSRYRPGHRPRPGSREGDRQPRAAVVYAARSGRAAAAGGDGSGARGELIVRGRIASPDQVRRRPGVVLLR